MIMYIKLTKIILRKLWSSINRISHINESFLLSDCSNNFVLSNSFGKFFSEKISKIRTPLNLKIVLVSTLNQITHLQTLLIFQPSNPWWETETYFFIRNKSWVLHSCPILIVKEYEDILTPPIMQIINLSLSDFCRSFQIGSGNSSVQNNFTLPNNEFKSYRPVSNLNYLSFWKKLFQTQIKSQIEKFALENPFQSTYKAFRST